MAQKMRYRGKEHVHTPGKTTDIFDGHHYRELLRKHVTVGQTTFSHQYFGDVRDVALGLSTDGFAPFKRHKNTAWPLILFNYNLPPEIRFHLEFILALGVIPGPRKPIDSDSFLWPFVREMLRLAKGVATFDILSSHMFSLHAHLIVAFGDIPAVSMIMCMKGHNGFSPCRMCEIHGLCGTRGTTLYVPLDRARHPEMRANGETVISRIHCYDAQNLPLRNHDNLLSQAAEVQSANTVTDAVRLAREYGIKRVPLLSYLPSLSFPHSFPYDFMHLIWENLIPNLIDLWTGGFKGLDEGKESYRVSDAVWQAVGQSTATSGSTIPSTYGSRVPNIATPSRSQCSAEMWSFWTLYIGPVLLRRRFWRKYYLHFISLVQLLSRCLQFEISDDERDEVRMGFIRWVQDYEK